MKKIIILILSGFIFITAGIAQTIGLKYISEDVSEGLTLFTPFVGFNTYLIDNCGRIVNQWNHDGRPNYGALITPEGDLYRSMTSNQGLILEKRNWNDSLVWSYDFTANGFQHHHDLTVLPNGNILFIAYDSHSGLEALMAGKDSSAIVVNNQVVNVFNTERIVEIEPYGINEANMVWEWKIWDHLIQDVDTGLSNYANLIDQTGKFDINFEYSNFGPPTPGDWLHFNGIDYNPELDQIIVSSRHASEVFILDHSTTTEEAATDLGGNSGQGGQFLWRWGNPQNYNGGTEDDKMLFGQHNPRWITNDNSHQGKISVFNNGDLRPEGNYSSVEVIAPPVDINGDYIKDVNNVFLPDTMDFSWTGMVESQVLSSIYISGVQFLDDDKILICEGVRGRFTEIDYSGHVNWIYKNPESDFIATQGMDVNNWVFKVTKYKYDYFNSNIDLMPGSIIENFNTNSDNCEFGLPLNISYENNYPVFKIHLSNNFLNITSDLPVDELSIVNSNGQIIAFENGDQIVLNDLINGLYILNIKFEGSSRRVSKKIIVSN